MATSPQRASQLQALVSQAKPKTQGSIYDPGGAGAGMGYVPPGGTWTVATDPGYQFLGGVINSYLAANPDFYKGTYPSGNTNAGAPTRTPTGGPDTPPSGRLPVTPAAKTAIKPSGTIQRPRPFALRRRFRR